MPRQHGMRVVCVRWDPISPRRLGSTTRGGLTVALLTLVRHKKALTVHLFISDYEALRGAAHNPGLHVVPKRPRLYDVSIPLGSRSGMNEWLFLWPLPPPLTLIDVWALARWRAFDGVCVLWTWRRASSIASCGRRDSRFLYEAKRECHSRPKRKPPSDPLQITWGPTSLPTPNSIGRISSAAA